MLFQLASFWLALFAASSPISGNPRQNVADKFVKDGVVPDLIDKAPQERLKVIFPSGKESNLGNELKPGEAQNQPAVTWLYYRENDLFTVSMSDLDVPNRQNPTRRSIDHWLVINVKGNDIAGGDVMAPYQPPHPSNNSGLHRYVQLVYKQSGPIDKTYLPSDLDTARPNFSIRDFAKQHNLGDSVAGNYFLSQFDNSVGG